MVKRANKYLGLPPETQIEVVATKDDKIIKKTMTILASQSMKKARGWVYRNYQLGYCTIKEKK